MERDINITLRFKLSIGETNLNELVYGLKELRDGLMLQILEQILKSYDDLISDRLSHTEVYPSKARKGLGRQVCKDDPNGRFCRGRKVYRRGYRQEPRKIATVFGELVLPIRTVTCRRCGARYSPLLSALKIGPYARKEMNFENEVIEAVIDTNYRRLIDGRYIDISLGGIHPRGLYHALWEDGLKKKESQVDTDKVKQLIGIELPKGDFQILKEQDKEPVRIKYESSKAEIQGLIKTFYEKGYQHGASYLEKLSERLFTNIEIWLKTGVIAPKTTSLLERVFREIGRRLKRIAWGWSDTAVTNLSKMILIKQYSRDKWISYWKEKLGIKGYFNIRIISVQI